MSMKIYLEAFLLSFCNACCVLLALSLEDAAAFKWQIEKAYLLSHEVRIQMHFLHHYRFKILFLLPTQV